MRRGVVFILAGAAAVSAGLHGGVFVAGPAAAAAAIADGPLTQGQLEQLLAERDYAGVLRESSRVLALRGQAAAGYDRHAVLLLKAEAHLRQRQLRLAQRALEEAVTAAADIPEAAGGDLARAQSAALLELTKRALPAGYKPQVAGGGQGLIPIDEPERRTEALTALFTDVRFDAEQQLAEAQKRGQIPAYLEAGAKLRFARQLELAATGQTALTDRSLERLVRELDLLTADALAKLENQATRISQEASEFVRVERVINVGGQPVRDTVWRRRGLSTDHRNALKSIGTTTAKLVEAAGLLARELPAGGEAFDRLARDARRVNQLAETVHDADYGGSYQNRP
ncbi:MAG: hypothetical protein ACFCVE_02425 [Phycisphaerae bacterium]